MKCHMSVNGKLNFNNLKGNSDAVLGTVFSNIVSFYKIEVCYFTIVARISATQSELAQA